MLLFFLLKKKRVCLPRLILNHMHRVILKGNKSRAALPYGMLLTKMLKHLNFPLEIESFYIPREKPFSVTSIKAMTMPRAPKDGHNTKTIITSKKRRTTFEVFVEKPKKNPRKKQKKVPEIYPSSSSSTDTEIRNMFEESSEHEVSEAPKQIPSSVQKSVADKGKRPIIATFTRKRKRSERRSVVIEEPKEIILSSSSDSDGEEMEFLLKKSKYEEEERRKKLMQQAQGIGPSSTRTEAVDSEETSEVILISDNVSDTTPSVETFFSEVTALDKDVGTNISSYPSLTLFNSSSNLSIEPYIFFYIMIAFSNHTPSPYSEIPIIITLPLSLPTYDQVELSLTAIDFLQFLYPDCIITPIQPTLYLTYHQIIPTSLRLTYEHISEPASPESAQSSEQAEASSSAQTNTLEHLVERVDIMDRKLNEIYRLLKEVRDLFT